MYMLFFIEDLRMVNDRTGSVEYKQLILAGALHPVTRQELSCCCSNGLYTEPDSSLPGKMHKLDPCLPEHTKETLK